MEVGSLQLVVACLLSGKGECLLCGLSYDILFAVLDIVYWYAVTPPQLTADTPVLDVL